MKKALLYFLICLAFGVEAVAQQDPIYAQYIMNPFAINPAYAGSNNMFNATIQYRKQWAGIDSNPTTVNFNSHVAVYHNKVGLGVQVVQDKLGDNTTTEFNTAYSYKIQLRDASFSFGMQMGFIRFTNNPASLAIHDPGDPYFFPFSTVKVNMGAGMLLKSEKYIIGLSVPRMLPASTTQNGYTAQLASQNYYLFGAYLFALSPTVGFRPSILLRGTRSSPFSTDVNASFRIKEVFTAGVFTRNLKSYGMLLQMNYGKYRFGYVFELPGSSQSSLRFPSHEFTLGISTAVFKSHDTTPATF